MEFKDIIGYESLYEISEKGLIRNKKKGKVLKPSIDTRGYYQVHFSKNGKSKKISVHRLLAENFILNPFNKSQVNHIDGNKLNNDLSNLEWVTASENIRHAWANGLCKMTDKNRETARLNATKVHSKQVIDLHTGIVFDSVVKACEALNFSYSTAIKHLNGISSKKRFTYV